MPSAQARIYIDQLLYSKHLEQELERACPQLYAFTSGPNETDEADILHHVVKAGGEVFLTQDPGYIFAKGITNVAVAALIIQGSRRKVPFSRLSAPEKAQVLAQLFEEKVEEILRITHGCIAHLEETSNWTIREPSTNEHKHFLKRFNP